MSNVQRAATTAAFLLLTRAHPSQGIRNVAVMAVGNRRKRLLYKYS